MRTTLVALGVAVLAMPLAAAQFVYNDAFNLTGECLPDCAAPSCPPPARQCAARYDAPATPQASLVCSEACAGLPLNLGGVAFGPRDEAGILTLDGSVLDDLANPSVAFVCQDLDGDRLCGEPGEPSVLACGAFRLVGRAELPVAIAVNVLDLDACASPAVASSGTVTAAYDVKKQ